MKLTAFGKELRKIRLDCEEILFDMATKLNISSAMLSGIETGSKPAPADFVEKLVQQYPAITSRRAELEHLAVLTKKTLTVPLDVSDEAKKVAFEFCRELPNMSPERLQQFKSLLETLERANGPKERGSDM